MYVAIPCLCWSGDCGAVMVEWFSVALIWLLIFSFTSSTSSFMSVASSVIWLSRASFIVVLICISSISSSRKATEHIMFNACFGIPVMAVIWCRHVDSDVCVASSPSGHSSRCFSKKFHPSSVSLMSWSSSIIKAVPFRLVFGLMAITGLGNVLLLSMVGLSLFVIGDMCAIVMGEMGRVKASGASVGVGWDLGSTC